MKKSISQSNGTVPAAKEHAPRVWCIIGLPRTGTNHLCSALGRIPEIDSRFEIFHPHRIYTMRPDELTEVSRVLGRDFEPSSDNPEAVIAVRQNPGLALDCILRSMEPRKRMLAFKVFAHHLSIETVRNEIIARPDTMVAFVRRRPIDTFISLQKALGLGQWSRVDTTDYKVPIDATEFLNWWQRGVAWYHALEAASLEHGKVLHHLSYEQDLDVSSMELAERLRPILASEGVGNLGPCEPDRPQGAWRQELNADLEQRVTNWPEFEDQLSALGARDKAFEPMPRFTPS